VTRILRNVGFLTINLVLRWPIWIVLAIVRYFYKFFDYLLLVYPGTDSDLYGYCPKKLAKSRLFSKNPTIAGIISKGSVGRGLTLVVPNTASDFSTDDDVGKEVMRRLVWIQQIIGAKSIALAGRLPSIISRSGNSLNKPFVRGYMGTVFCVMETISQVMQTHGIDIKHTRIAVVGIGYTGGQLLDTLKREGFDATGIDIYSMQSGVVLQERAAVILGKADIVVVLTAEGSDFVHYVKHLKKKAIIIDDTHPKITEQPSEMTFYKVAVGMKDVKFHPRLPGYKRDWIPGCAVEAMVVTTGDFDNTSQEEFNKRAKELGFFAHMVR
jgi:hypothetical protein